MNIEISDKIDLNGYGVEFDMLDLDIYMHEGDDRVHFSATPSRGNSDHNWICNFFIPIEKLNRILSLLEKSRG